MALTSRTAYYLKTALADRTAALEMIAAVNAAETLTPAADVAAVSPSIVVAVTTADNTKPSIDTALAAVIADIQANRTKINAILTALKAAGLML